MNKKNKIRPSMDNRYKIRNISKNNKTITAKPRSIYKKKVLIENRGFDYEVDAYMNSATNNDIKLEKQSSIMNNNHKQKRKTINDCLGIDFELGFMKYSVDSFNKLKNKRKQLVLNERRMDNISVKEFSKSFHSNIRISNSNNSIQKNRLDYNRTNQQVEQRSKTRSFIIRNKTTVKNRFIKAKANQSRNQLKENQEIKTSMKSNLKQRKRIEFTLEGINNITLKEYNGLYDKNLTNYFCRNKEKLMHLFKMGFITKNGYIINKKLPALKNQLCNRKNVGSCGITQRLVPKDK